MYSRHNDLLADGLETHTSDRLVRSRGHTQTHLVNPHCVLEYRDENTTGVKRAIRVGLPDLHEWFHVDPFMNVLMFTKL